VCRLHGVLDEALQAFYRVLDGYTLADLVRNPRALSRLLFVQEAAR
jgi:Rrf2 family nitric oxide-sensitive transcriptional repressor